MKCTMGVFYMMHKECQGPSQLRMCTKVHQDCTVQVYHEYKGNVANKLYQGCIARWVYCTSKRTKVHQVLSTVQSVASSIHCTKGSMYVVARYTKGMKLHCTKCSKVTKLYCTKCSKGVVARGQFAASATESKMSAKLDCCTARPKHSSA